MRSRQLFVPQSLLNEIISHCREVYPNEACGIFAGRNGIAQMVYKMTNIESSSVTYMMDSREQFAVMKEMRKEGLEIVAIYHSHPHSDAYPSPRDISLAFYPDSLYVIVSLIHEDPVIKAFEIKDEIVREVEVRTVC
ncbi:MAG: M67 family metallopeptidase [Nitrospirota bacterium]